MPGLLRLLQWEVAIFLFALACIVILQLLTGQINTRGLLYGRVSGRPNGKDLYFSPERVQLLLMTLGSAYVYLSQLLANPTALPDIPATWIGISGGSNLIYLGGRAWARWLAKAESK